MGVESRGEPRADILFPKFFLHSLENFQNFTFSQRNFFIFIRWPFFKSPSKISNFSLYFLCFTAFFRKTVSHLPQIFHFLSLFTTFSFFIKFRAPVTEPGPGAVYPLTSL